MGKRGPKPLPRFACVQLVTTRRFFVVAAESPGAAQARAASRIRTHDLQPVAEEFVESSWESIEELPEEEK